MKDYIQIGIDKGLISFNEDRSRILYVYQKKERNYNNPEEKVQAEAFLKLILDYNYPESHIRQFVPFQELSGYHHGTPLCPFFVLPRIML